jgi:hypothetical protein
MVSEAVRGKKPVIFVTFGIFRGAFSLYTVQQLPMDSKRIAVASAANHSAVCRADIFSFLVF